MAKRVHPQFKRMVAEHRERLRKLAQVRGVNHMKDVYEQAAAQVQAQLRRAIRAGKGDTFTAYQQRVVLTQLREGMAVTGQRMTKAMQPLAQSVQQQALKGLSEDVSRLHKFFTGADITLPIEEAARFKGIIDRRQTSLLQMNAGSVQRYGQAVVNKVQNQLAVSLVSAEPTSVVMDKVADIIDGEWWQGERIVRTELAWAYNGALRDGIKESAQDITDLYQRWEENCGDSGQPLDNRVAVDSIAMHGQVAKAGGLFVMPPVAPFADAKGETEVPKSLVGKAWEFPPNRPNDRSVLSPWMQSWGIPGWRYVGGRRVPL